MTSKSLKSHLNFGLLASLTALLASWLIFSSVSAITTLSEAYVAEDDIAVGSIVALKANTSDTVVAAASGNADSVMGVIIHDGNSLLTLTHTQGERVQVATAGLVPVLVSDLNGEIKQGDHITASPITGVGMKATANTKVIGIAQGEVTGQTENYDYDDGSGNKQTVKLGQVLVAVNAAYYFKEPESTIIPGALQDIANSVAGKQVEPLPIVISGAIFLITLIIVSSIIYSMIRSSIISVGRNPLAQSAVYRDVIQLSALVLAILGVALASIYLVLTRL